MPAFFKADVLWCRGVPYGAVGWAQRNISVFTGRSRQARGFRALIPWPTSCAACPEEGQEEIKEYPSVSRPPSCSLTLIAVGAAGNVPLATFSQVTCAEVVQVVPLWAPCDLVPWFLTFLEVMRVGSGGPCIPGSPPLESNILEDYVL